MLCKIKLKVESMFPALALQYLNHWQKTIKDLREPGEICVHGVNYHFILGKRPTETWHVELYYPDSLDSLSQWCQLVHLMLRNMDIFPIKNHVLYVILCIHRPDLRWQLFRPQLTSHDIHLEFLSRCKLFSTPIPLIRQAIVRQRERF